MFIDLLAVLRKDATKNLFHKDKDINIAQDSSNSNTGKHPISEKQGE